MWDALPKPFFALAPLDDVTDVVFREMVANAAKPDLFFTEFTNCDALFSKGREVTLPRLRFTENQRPIISQLWGVRPENFYKAAQLVAELGFDGIDINMGCPDKNVRKAGACSAMIDNRTLAAEVIVATQEGARLRQGSGGRVAALPVSVKTRLGVTSIMTEDWIGWLLEKKLAAVIIHGRTVQEMSDVPAHWDEISRAVELRNEVAPDTYIVGNGDVISLQDGRDKALAFGVDGVMVGRGIFKNLWFFSESMPMVDRPIAERLAALRQHVELFLATWGDAKNPATMKKFLKMYVSDFPGASALRDELMQLSTLEVLIERVRELEAEG